ISKERAAHLQRALDAATVEQDGEKLRPFQTVTLTGADVFWLAVRVLAGPLGQVPEAEAQLRAIAHDGPLLPERHLDELPLEKATCELAPHLEGANLSSVHLEGAILGISPHLEGANLSSAHLEGANLMGASLEGADL